MGNESGKKEGRGSLTPRSQKDQGTKEIAKEVGSSSVQEKLSERKLVEKDVEESQVGEEWLTPGKTGRGLSKQKDLKYGEVKITPSRFAALSGSDKEGKNQEKEDDKNEESEAISSDDEVKSSIGEKETDNLELQLLEDIDRKKQQGATVSQRPNLPRASKKNHKSGLESAVPTVKDNLNMRNRKAPRNNH